MPDRIAMHRWPGLSQDGGDPQAQADGHAIEALAPVLTKCWWLDYERQQPGLRKLKHAQTGGTEK